MSRLGWLVKPLNSYKYWQISDDVVTYSGWSTVTVDLQKIKMNRGRYGWKNISTQLRFDPHEDRLPRRFYVDDIALREDDTLTSFFDIKFNIEDTDDGSVNLSIYGDRDRTFGNGNELFISNVAAGNGNQSYRWAPSASVKGTFWIYIQANDGLNTRGFYSSGPLKVH
jgi:hypothetical protein